MWHGGSNFGRWSGGPYIVTSYDYDVALDEYGTYLFIYSPKYRRLYLFISFTLLMFSNRLSK